MNVGTISQVYNGVLDKSTFCGAFEYIIRTLRNAYPSAKIVWVRPHNMASRPYIQQKEWGNLAQEICEKYGVPVADIYKKGNMIVQDGCNSQQGVHTESDADRTHPGNSGYELFYMPIIESTLNSI